MVGKPLYFCVVLSKRHLVKILHKDCGKWKLTFFSVTQVSILLLLSNFSRRSDYHNVLLGLTTLGICDVIVWSREVEAEQIKRWNFMQKKFSSLLKELLESSARKPSSAVKHNFEPHDYWSLTIEDFMWAMNKLKKLTKMTKIGSNSEMNQNPIMDQNQNWNEINNNG